MFSFGVYGDCRNKVFSRKKDYIKIMENSRIIKNNDSLNRSYQSPIDINPADGLKFVLSRQYTKLFKEFLFILEKSKDEHIECLNKLYDELPEEYKNYVTLADWLTDDKSERLRKEVLQRGNDAIREMEMELNKYDIDFRK
jgi:hypothetical protein